MVYAIVMLHEMNTEMMGLNCVNVGNLPLESLRIYFRNIKERLKLDIKINGEIKKKFFFGSIQTLDEAFVDSIHVIELFRLFRLRDSVMDL